MNTMSFCRYALVGVGVAVLAACSGEGGGNAAGAIPAISGASPNVYTHHKTFHYTGNRQSFIVPENVKRLKVVARGAEGDGSTSSPGARPGLVEAVIPVTAGEQLYVFVGGPGSGQAAGFNGGGNGGSSGACECKGYGGGGASDVRKGSYRLNDRILVAGGGGGSGGNGDEYYDLGGRGGSGGGTEASPGSTGAGDGSVGGGGGGGTQSNGGAGGGGGSGSPGGIPGSLGIGGDGGGSTSGHSGGGGGGGGGGYYGGGGGGGGAASSEGDPEAGGGGGGGSSWIEADAITYHFWRGWKKSVPTGIVVFSWNV